MPKNHHKSYYQTLNYWITNRNRENERPARAQNEDNSPHQAKQIWHQLLQSHFQVVYVLASTCWEEKQKWEHDYTYTWREENGHFDKIAMPRVEHDMRKKNIKLPIKVVLINGSANLRITYKHVNFQLSLSICNMGSHCCTKRSTSKHHNLKTKIN